MVQAIRNVDNQAWASVRADIARGESAYRDAGTKLLLLKGTTPHGEWLPRLKAAEISGDKAERLMRLAKSDAGVTYSEVCNPVSNSASTRNIRKPKEELPVRYDLMGQIVDAGFKALSKKSHPDAGGESATQAELSSARSALREVIRALKEQER